MEFRAKLVRHGAIATRWTEQGRVGGTVSEVMFTRDVEGVYRTEPLTAPEVAALRPHNQVVVEAQGLATSLEAVAEAQAPDPTPEPAPKPKPAAAKPQATPAKTKP